MSTAALRSEPTDGYKMLVMPELQNRWRLSSNGLTHAEGQKQLAQPNKVLK